MTELSNMHVWTLVETCLIQVAVGFFGVKLIIYVYLSCATFIKSVFQRRRQDAKSRRVLSLLFGTDNGKQLETFYIESGELCCICLVRLFYFAVLNTSTCEFENSYLLFIRKTFAAKKR